MNLAPCAACHRHIRNDASQCPFCSASIQKLGPTPDSRIRNAVAVAVGVGLALSMCACYGPPPRHSAIPSDAPDPNQSPSAETPPPFAQPPAQIAR